MRVEYKVTPETKPRGLVLPGSLINDAAQVKHDPKMTFRTRQTTLNVKVDQVLLGKIRFLPFLWFN